MRPRWRKVLRDLWLHKPRTALVVLAIAIGIIGAGAVLDTWSLLKVVTRNEYRDTNPASATIRTDSIDAPLLERVRALPGIRDAAARRTVMAAVKVAGEWRSALLFASNDFATSRIGKVVGEKAQWPPTDGAFVIEHSSVQFAGVGVGDSVSVRIGEGAAMVLPVTGVARDAGLAPGWMEHVVYAFVTPATLARLGAPSSLNQLQIVARDGDAPSMDRAANRRAALEVQAVAERTGHPVLDVEVPEPGRHIHAAQMDSLLMIQGAFGVLSLFLSGFLVINLVAAMLAGQVREIGVMKAIGARPGQLAAMYLAIALALGVVACVIAVPAAMLLGRAYAEFAAGLLNFSVAGVAIPWPAITLQVAVGALLPVAAATVPVWRGCRISVGEALRDLGIGAGPAAASGRILGRATGVARPLLLSLRNAFRRRQRMALTLATLAMGGAVFLGALNLRASIRGSVGLLYGEYNRFDLSIRFTQAHSVDSIEAAVARVSGVSRAEAWGGARASIDMSDGMLANSFPITALAPDSKLVAYPVQAGRWLGASGEREIVVSKRLALDEPTLVPGHEVSLIIDGRSSRWTVVGIVEMGPAPGAWTSLTALARTLGDARVRVAVASASLKGVASQSELMQRLRTDLGAAGFEVDNGQLVQANRVVVEDHLLMVAGFLLVMAQLTIVVGGLGLASTMSLAVLERTREIGVLRAIGARHGAILGMIQVEGLVISLLSWLLAIPLSLPMSVFLGRAFARVMFPVATTFVPEWSGVATWFGVVLVVSLAACAWPASRATRIPTAVALAYE
ncbi:MAG: ABC transporter permease [Gemmatimonadales bacterium]